MAKKFREMLEEVRCFLCDYQKYIPYTHEKILMDIFGNIQTVLYGILTQHPDNDYAEEDMDSAVDAIKKLKEYLEKENAIQ